MWEKRLNDFKNQYDAIPIPDEIDECLERAIRRGMAHRKFPHWQQILAVAAISVLIGTGAFFWLQPDSAGQIAQDPPATKPPLVTVTDPPPPADDPEDPVIFVGPLTSGDDTDESGGTQVQPRPTIDTVSISKEAETESIVISLAPEKFQAASWQVDYLEDQNEVTLSGDGVAELTNDATLEKLRSSEYISDVFPLGETKVTVVLKEQAHMEIQEGIDPSQYVLTLTRQDREYVLRTNAYGTEEELSLWKERLTGEPVVVHGDATNGFYLTTGEFKSRSEAELKLSEILAEGDMDLFIEELSGTPIGNLPAVEITPEEPPQFENPIPEQPKTEEEWTPIPIVEEE
jgi:hypothetical protein